MGVPMGGGEEWCGVYTDERNGVTFYFIEHEKFFGRDGIYGTQEEPDFLDNPRRFTFLSRSVFQLCRKIDWFPDILHAHDWPTALVPVFLKFRERYGEFAKTVSILTIHNLGYQGIYNIDNYANTGMGWEVFRQAGFEDWNMMNMLKAGISSSDLLNTVSETYAEETKTQGYGFRLDSVLRSRAWDYRGILNGVDTEVWNPAKDTYIPKKYSIRDMSGKAVAKKALQEEFGLKVDADVPLIGIVTRLVDQKGVGALFGPTFGSAYSFCRDMKLEFALLGSGETWCENELKSLSWQLPNFKAKIGYSERVSHLVEAGADFFLMPSRYEPSGLNQMYSLNYGTIPIVRHTGGLADTVENYNQETGEGTGFMFNDLTPDAIYNTVGWAVWAWYNKPEDIKKMRKRGMEKDFSWATSAKKYVDMYEDALNKI
jgi:starch synthase